MKNNEEYLDPVQYDLEQDRYTDDCDWIIRQLRGKEERIIDLACGTGRLSIPLAEAGHDVVGVDVQKEMLEAAAKKVSEGLSITFTEQDCTKLSLPEKATVITMVGNSFQHFLTNEDQWNLLSGVSYHLETDGLFIFDTRFPSEEELRACSGELWGMVENEQGQTVRLIGTSTYDSVRQWQSNQTVRRISDGERVLEESQTNITLRFTYPQELQQLLTAHGLAVEAWYKDWHGNLLDESAQSIIVVCRKSTKR